MTTRALALACLLGLGFTGGTAYMPIAQARTYVDVGIDVAPPPPRYEAVVARPGFEWTPGYWRWDDRGHRHEWVGGVYVPERRGYAWRPHRWEHAPDGHYHFVEGGWDHR